MSVGADRAGCARHGVACGFSGVLTGERTELRVRFACGCTVEVGHRAEVSAFTERHDLAITWCDPAAGVVGRGGLSQVPLFYRHVPAVGVRFSTTLADLITPGCRPHAGVVAALLGGQGIPVPLTPYRGLLRLAAGTVLSATAEGQARIGFTQVDWAGLRPSGRSRLTGVVGQGLAAAVGESGAGLVALSGGPASAALYRVAAAGQVRPVHVHVGVPILERRRVLVDEVEVLDGTHRWEAARDAACPPLPHQCDPWPQVGVLTGASAGMSGRVVSGYGLMRLFTRPATRLSWWRRGWRSLSAELPEEHLLGQAGWRAFHPPAPDGHTHDDRDGWLGESLSAIKSSALGGNSGSHLLGGTNGGPEALRQVVGRVVDLVDGLGMADPAAGQPGGGTVAVVYAALHPAVVGAAVEVALTEGDLPRWRAGRAILAPGLTDLAGDAALAPEDVPTSARERLFAADLVGHRLAGASARTQLLAELADSSWVAVDRLKAGLAEPGHRLAHSLVLHRLIALAARYPAALLETAEGKG